MLDLDHPAIVSRLFYPRSAQAHTSTIPLTNDGLIDLPDGEKLGYRLYRPDNPDVVIVYFHGNGEVAGDYDFLAPKYFEIGAALLIVDYRGYGWSTGTPLTSKLLPDAEVAVENLPDILGDLDSLPKYIMGRSLGSAPAVHIAHETPQLFKGLIVESGIADMPTAVRNLGISLALSVLTKLPIGNVRRMQDITLPLLVIHGEDDQLLTIDNGEKLYNASPAGDKTFYRVPQAGHNDIMFVAGQRYFDEIAALIQRTR